MQMQKRWRTPICLFVLVLTIATLSVTGFATAGVDFSVVPQTPENRVPDSSGYFDLIMEPGKVQDLTITVQNPTDQEVLVTVDVVTATTNRNGIINYATPGTSDETLTHAFADLAQVHESELLIPPQSTKDAVVTVTMPNELYEGKILGGIRILKPVDQQPGTEAKEDEEGSGTSIANQYSYVFGVGLTVSDTPVEPEFMVDKAAAELFNYRVSVVNYIRNTKPIIVRDVEVSAEVYQEGNEKPLFTQTQKDIEMAPNSVMEYTLSDEAGYGLPAGNYTSKIKVSHSGKNWEFEKDFIVEPEEAQNLNESAMNTEQSQPIQNAPLTSGGKSGLPVWAIVLIVVGGVLILGLVALFVITMAKIKKENRAFEMQRMEQLEELQQVQDSSGINLK